MSVEREFLGWDRPFLGLVVDWLMGRRGEMPGMCVVVPTAQSGRRLREALAERGGCLAPRVTTPGRLMATEGVAPESAEVLAWVEVLEGVADWSVHEAAFPTPPGDGEEPGWALAMARSLAGVRRALQENGWTVASAARALAGTAEADRWQSLADLEGKVEDLLKNWGMPSRTRELARRAAEGMAAPGRIVLAGVSDFPPVLARALKDRGAVVLIAAPEREADNFDDWGRPVPEIWCARPMPWPEEPDRVGLCADPRQQALEAVRRAAEAGSPSDALALGSADEEVAGELERAFARAGWSAHNPAGAKAAPEARWFAAWRAFLANPGAAEVVDLLGMPETGALCGGKRVQRVRAISALRDRWLLRSSEDLEQIRKLERHDEDSVTLAAETFERLERWRAGFLRDDFAAAMDRLLAKIDAAGEMVGVREWLESMRGLIPNVRRGAGFWIDLMSAELQGASPEPPEQRVIDVQGWLELLLEPGRHLIVCGMNEGKVPSAIGGDTWMPEGVRKPLGLPRDESRAARDAYLLRAMLEARRSDGARVDLLLGKSSAGGDALLPSRLLLAAESPELPERVEKLFADIEPPDAGLAWTADWKWKPRPPEGNVPERLSITQFGTYLACPFRFYLKHIQRMQEPEPERVEWNARDFGTFAHKVLENWGRDETARDFSKTDAIEKWLHAELDRLLAERFGSRIPLAVRIQAAALRQRLSWFANVQACERAKGWEIEEVEKKFEFELGGVTVVGQADRIERHADGRRRVLDYKTFGERRKVESEHRKRIVTNTVLPPHLEGVAEVLCECVEKKKTVTKRWTNLQVPLYAAGLGDIDEIGYFILGATEENVDLELWDNFCEVDKESALRCAEWVVRQIREKQFWPPAEKVQYDDFEALAMGRPLADMIDAP